MYPLADISVKISGQAEASFEIVDVVYHPAANYDMVRISERDRERHTQTDTDRATETERERERERVVYHPATNDDMARISSIKEK